MEKPQKHLIIVAGEASGDDRAAELVAQIRKRDPSFTFSGLGGTQMAENGVEIDFDLTRMAVVGFGEVLKHLSAIKKVFRLVLQKIDKKKPLAVILVDYPGFNLRLAQELKKRNVKVIYYISPQVWAWNARRIETIKRIVDRMIVFFRFEEALYARHGYTVDWVGHPLIDRVKVDRPREAFLNDAGLSASLRTIGLLPGSREKEIQKIFPVMLKTAAYLYQKNPQLQFLAFQAPTISAQSFESHVKNLSIPLKIVSGQTYNGVNACDFCLVASGTATLETAILQKPMIVVYKTSFLTWALAKILIKIPDIGLVNVVAEKRIVPECVQFNATPQAIALKAISLLSHEEKLNEIRQALAEVKDKLGAPGASGRAAEKILALIA